MNKVGKPTNQNQNNLNRANELRQQKQKKLDDNNRKVTKQLEKSADNWQNSMEQIRRIARKSQDSSQVMDNIFTENELDRSEMDDPGKNSAIPFSNSADHSPAYNNNNFPGVGFHNNSNFQGTTRPLSIYANNSLNYSRMSHQIDPDLQSLHSMNSRPRSVDFRQVQTPLNNNQNNAVYPPYSNVTTPLPRYYVPRPQQWPPMNYPQIAAYPPPQYMAQTYSNFYPKTPNFQFPQLPTVNPIPQYQYPYPNPYDMNNNYINPNPNPNPAPFNKMDSNTSNSDNNSMEAMKKYVNTLLDKLEMLNETVAKLKASNNTSNHYCQAMHEQQHYQQQQQRPQLVNHNNNHRMCSAHCNHTMRNYCNNTRNETPCCTRMVNNPHQCNSCNCARRYSTSHVNRQPDWSNQYQQTPPTHPSQGYGPMRSHHSVPRNCNMMTNIPHHDNSCCSHNSQSSHHSMNNVVPNYSESSNRYSTPIAQYNQPRMPTQQRCATPNRFVSNSHAQKMYSPALSVQNHRLYNDYNNRYVINQSNTESVSQHIPDTPRPANTIPFAREEYHESRYPMRYPSRQMMMHHQNTNSIQPQAQSQYYNTQSHQNTNNSIQPQSQSQQYYNTQSHQNTNNSIQPQAQSQQYYNTQSHQNTNNSTQPQAKPQQYHNNTQSHQNTNNSIQPQIQPQQYHNNTQSHQNTNNSIQPQAQPQQYPNTQSHQNTNNSIQQQTQPQQYHNNTQSHQNTNNSIQPQAKPQQYYKNTHGQIESSIISMHSEQSHTSPQPNEHTTNTSCNDSQVNKHPQILTDICNPAPTLTSVLTLHKSELSTIVL